MFASSSRIRSKLVFDIRKNHKMSLRKVVEFLKSIVKNQCRIYEAGVLIS